MHAIAPLLFFFLFLASPELSADARPQPAPPLLLEAVSASQAPARFRLQPPAGALVSIADGNGDGLQDVVVIASRNRGAWLLPGDGKGALGSIERFDAPMGPHGVGDLDADGASEQLYGGSFGSEIVLVQGKTGAASTALSADLDGDGRPDLARLEDASLRLTFAGNEREERVPVGPDAVSLATADLDRDGSLDLLVADAHADQVSVFLGDAQGRFRAAGGHRVWVRPFSIATGDLDADGAVDLVVSDQCGSTMALLRGNGKAGFGNPILITQPSGPGSRPVAEVPAVPAVKSLTLSPTTLPRTGGTASLATVRLEGPAPADGLTVRLRSSDSALVAGPDEVLVPAGETSVTFPVTASPDARRGRLAYLATLTAATTEASASATLTVTPE